VSVMWAGRVCRARWRGSDDSSSIILTARVCVTVWQVCLATGRRPHNDVVVSADLDLRGNLGAVDGLPGKLAGCKVRKRGRRIHNKGQLLSPL
jgi:hypothetical protein